MTAQSVSEAAATVRDWMRGNHYQLDEQLGSTRITTDAFHEAEAALSLLVERAERAAKLEAELEEAKQARAESSRALSEVYAKWGTLEADAERAASLEATLGEVTKERDHLYDQEWPWEWVIASREKKRREAAEARAASLRDALEEIADPLKGLHTPSYLRGLARAALAAGSEGET